MNVLIAWMRIGFGLVFVAAGVGKILFPADFAQIIYNYQMVPDILVHPMAIILPWVELVCGVALATDCFKRGAATILSVLLLIFLGALWFNVSRGLDVNCGCFTVDPDAKGNLMQAAVRDTILFAVGLVVLWRAFADAAARRASAKLWRQLKGIPEPGAKPRRKKKGKDLLDYAPPEPVIEDGTLVVGMASRVGKGGADDVPSFGEEGDSAGDDSTAAVAIPVPEAVGDVDSTDQDAPEALAEAVSEDAAEAPEAGEAEADTDASSGARKGD